MNGTLIIGWGNALRGDDGAGLRAAEQLEAALPEADVVAVQQLQIELAERMAQAPRVIFIDASMRTDRLSIETLTPLESPVVTTHTFDPRALLTICSSLYGRVPEETVLIEIPAFDCTIGEGMTEASQRCTDRCVELVTALVRGTAYASVC